MRNGFFIGAVWSILLLCLFTIIPGCTTGSQQDNLTAADEDRLFLKMPGGFTIIARNTRRKTDGIVRFDWKAPALYRIP